MKSGYLSLIGVLVCLLYSCSIELGICRLNDHYECVPVPAYENWNRCINDCDDLKLKSKTKPYKAKQWIRPRPYAYP